MLNFESIRLPRSEFGYILTVGVQTLMNVEKTRPTFVKQIQVERNYS